MDYLGAQLVDWFFPKLTQADSVLIGVLAGLAFCAGLLLIYMMPRYKWWWATFLLILITPVVLSGFWFSEGELGISDWDYYFALHTTHRETLLEYGELPHWNPYICGGTAGIAEPEFRFFTPTFLLQLWLGVPAGLRLATWLATATGAVGMLWLSRRLGLSVYASLATAIGVAFSSVNLLEVVEGHPNIFAAMFVPWIFWAWLGAYRATRWEKIFKWTIVAGGLLALTFFQGGIYLLMYTALAYIGLCVMSPRRLAALLTSVLSGVWGLGLAAIKLIPSLLWLSEVQDQAYASSVSFWRYLHYVLLGRILHGVANDNIIPNQGSGWHEYGAYVGPVVLGLALVGVVVWWKKRVVKMLLLSAAAAVLLATSGEVLKPFFDQVSFIPRSNISRFMLFAVIPLAILAGFGVDAIWHKRRRVRQGAALVLVGLMAVDLFSLAYPLSEMAFVIPRLLESIEPAPAPIAYTTLDYTFNYYQTEEGRILGRSSPHPRKYEALLRGYGPLSYCPTLIPTPAVATIHDEAGNGIVSFQGVGNSEDTRGEFRLQSWSPNRVVVDVTVPALTEVILNANYARAWQVNGEPAVERLNRVATVVAPGEHRLVFSYFTPGFRLGLAVSVGTLLLAGWLTINSKPTNSWRKVGR